MQSLKAFFNLISNCSRTRAINQQQQQINKELNARHIDQYRKKVYEMESVIDDILKKEKNLPNPEVFAQILRDSDRDAAIFRKNRLNLKQEINDLGRPHNREDREHFAFETIPNPEKIRVFYNEAKYFSKILGKSITDAVATKLVNDTPVGWDWTKNKESSFYWGGGNEGNNPVDVIYVIEHAKMEITIKAAEIAQAVIESRALD